MMASLRPKLTFVSFFMFFFCTFPIPHAGKVGGNTCQPDENLKIPVLSSKVVTDVVAERLIALSMWEMQINFGNTCTWTNKQYSIFII